MTAMATTILMSKRERGTSDPKKVNQPCTELVLPGIRAKDLELGKPLTHEEQNPGGNIQGAKIQAADFGSENHSPTGAKSGLRILARKTTHPRWAKSGLRILDSEYHSLTGAKSGLRILGSENHSKSGEQNRGRAKSRQRIWDSENHPHTLIEKYKRCLGNYADFYVIVQI